MLIFLAAGKRTIFGMCTQEWNELPLLAQLICHLQDAKHHLFVPIRLYLL